MEWNETFTSNSDGAPRRKLSTEGYNAAVAYGLAHLNEKHKSRGETMSGARSGRIEYVGDHVNFGPLLGRRDSAQHCRSSGVTETVALGLGLARGETCDRAVKSKIKLH
jgi:hypothetical protein